MRLHCANCRKVCLVISPDRAREYQYELGAKIVCRECLGVYRMARDLVRAQCDDSAVKNLMDMFGVK